MSLEVRAVVDAVLTAEDLKRVRLRHASGNSEAGEVPSDADPPPPPDAGVIQVEEPGGTR